MHRKIFIALFLAAACGEPRAPRDIMLATTTSVEDSGLLDKLVPAFEAEHPRYAVKPMAVGSGQAFELGRRGDVDVLITHAPAEEAAFVGERHGVEAIPIMHNRFVVVGPAADPAHVRGATSAADAFDRIADAGSSFVSRGDDSGTHIRERAIWESAGIAPDGQSWYTEAGVGMGDVLRIAGERDAYTMSDRATFVVAGPETGLELLLDAAADSALHNPYSVTAVAQAPNAEGALAFVDWIRSAETQALIGRYGAGNGGGSLFEPANR